MKYLPITRLLVSQSEIWPMLIYPVQMGLLVAPFLVLLIKSQRDFWPGGAIKATKTSRPLSNQLLENTCFRTVVPGWHLFEVYVFDNAYKLVLVMLIGSDRNNRAENVLKIWELPYHQVCSNRLIDNITGFWSLMMWWLLARNDEVWIIPNTRQYIHQATWLT